MEMETRSNGKKTVDRDALTEVDTKQYKKKKITKVDKFHIKLKGKRGRKKGRIV